MRVRAIGVFVSYVTAIVATWMQMVVLSSKNPECITMLPLLPN